MKNLLFILLLTISINIFAQTSAVKIDTLRCINMSYSGYLGRNPDGLSTFYKDKEKRAKSLEGYEQIRRDVYGNFNAHYEIRTMATNSELIAIAALGTDYYEIHFAKDYFNKSLKDSLLREGKKEFSRLKREKNKDLNYFNIVNFTKTLVGDQDLFIMLAYCKRNNYKIFYLKTAWRRNALFLTIASDIQELYQFPDDFLQTKILTYEDLQKMNIELCKWCK